MFRLPTLISLIIGGALAALGIVTGRKGLAALAAGPGLDPFLLLLIGGGALLLVAVALWTARNRVVSAIGVILVVAMVSLKFGP